DTGPSRGIAMGHLWGHPIGESNGKRRDRILDTYHRRRREGEEVDPAELDDHLPPNPISLSFTVDGLRALEVPEEAIATFPIAFTDGMAPKVTHGDTSRRAGILGDYGPNDSANWAWGGRQDSGGGPGRQSDIHLMLAVFGWRRKRVDQVFKTLISDASGTRLATQGARIDTRLVTREEGGGVEDSIGKFDRIQMTEHFGYRDAISQPFFEGTQRARDASEVEKRFHQVPVGDFVLGFRNSRKQPTPDISLPEGADPQSYLPLTEAHKPDFGRFGSFQVVRQLEQDVPGFNRLVEAAADRLGAEPEPPATGPEWLATWRKWMHGLPADLRKKERAAALLMGRWRDGTPLIAETGLPDPQHPGQALRENQPPQPANNFGFHHMDSAGLICPIGSHVRRVNPRDCLPPGPDKSLELTLGHRIMRRSRLYGPAVENGAFEASDTSPRGLLFICFNTDLNRQFEFTQHTWINNPNFGRQTGEIDPILGTQDRGRTHASIADRPLPHRLELGQQIVRVKGGAYLFLPGLPALRYLARK
ncbi:MAG: hypothetical protein AAGF44_11700, partial [Pseudomonadota bacterium]